MKKIIRHGYGRYHAICDHCTCHFTYELEDVCYRFDAAGIVESMYVTCPECGLACYHDTSNPDRTSIKLGVEDIPGVDSINGIIRVDET